MAAIFRYWTMPCSYQGIVKAMIDYSVRERNLAGSQGRLCTKRKQLALSFLHFADSHGISQYETE